MKKLLALLIAMALAATMMAGCGSDDQQTSSQDNSETEKLVDDTLGEIFQEASEIGQGTAGVSLKEAQLAARIASYAAVIGYTAEATQELKEEMLDKYAALDEQGQQNVDSSFQAAFGLLDQAIVEGDYDSIKGQFEDAGAADGFDILLKAPGLRESYDTFKSAYMSMGTTDD